MEDHRYQELLELLSEQTGVKTAKIFFHSRIGRDLGVDGDDGLILIREYSIKFNVDISLFNYNLYFGPEGCNPFYGIAYWVFGIGKLKPITVEDLYKGIIEGKLIMT